MYAIYIYICVCACTKSKGYRVQKILEKCDRAETEWFESKVGWYSR